MIQFVRGHYVTLSYVTLSIIFSSVLTIAPGHHFVCADNSIRPDKGR